MPEQHDSLVKKALKSKLLIVVEIGVLVMFSSALVKEVVHKHQVESEVNKLQEELTRLEQSNIELGNLIKYLESPEYTEEQARLKLGLQKPGEKVVAVLGDATDGAETVDGGSSTLAAAQASAPNPQKWWNYFFN